MGKGACCQQDKLSSVARIHVIERPDLHKLSCDLTCRAVVRHSHTHTHPSKRARIEFGDGSRA